MTHNPTVIVGAGLAGLIAAHAWPGATVVEKMPEPRAVHRALLRFRSDAVSRLTGIEFRKVLVRKGIFWGGRFREPDVRLANWYAQKCLGRLAAERSIWNLNAAERYVAPDDFYEQLLSAVRSRIAWHHDWRPSGEPTVSTAPLSETVRHLGIPLSVSTPGRADFHRAPITTLRALLPPGTDVYQTVYFPDPTYALYRASITGRTLIMEFAGESESGMTHAAVALGIGALGWEGELQRGSQAFGKIAPMDDFLRKQLLFRLTHERNVYSLGRFATWRNILLDDVVDDIASIKRLLKSGAGAYDISKEAHR